MFRRISSRASESQENSFFGCLFQLCENQPLHEQSEISHFLRQNLVDQHSYQIVKNRIEHLRQALAIMPIEIVLQNEDILAVLERMVSIFPQAIAFYSGHKRIGYKAEHLSGSVRLHSNTLMARSGQNPEYLFILGLRNYFGESEIEFANAIGSDSVLTTLGTLPIRGTDSHGETELEFHGISNAIFAELVKNNQQPIRNIEEEHDCIVELKEQIALIIVYCSKDSAVKLKKEFEELIGKIREDLNAERRVVHYQGNTKIVMRAGGELEDIIKEKYINQCMVANIHPDASKEDLLDLFSEFALFRQLILHEPEQGQLLKTATIHFYSQKDYQIFYQCFHGCILFELPLEVKPIRSKGDMSSVRPMKYIEFRWYVWASCRRALVQFIDVSTIPKALEGFQLNPIFDEAKVNVSWDDNSLVLENLSSHTDELYIEKALKGYGQIKKVELLRYPIREQTHPDQYLEKLICKIVKPNQQGNVQFRMEQVKREVNGQRTCRVHFTDGEALIDVAVAYNQKPRVLGEGRLYAQSVFEKPVLIPSGLKKIYLQIFQQTLKDTGLRGIDFRMAEQKQLQYVVLTGSSEKMVENAYNKYLKNLRPSQIQLSKAARKLLFNDIALSNLLYLQEKYQCRLIFDHSEKKVRVLANSAVLNHVKKEITDKITNSFFYYIRLNSYSYKHLQAHPELIQQLQNQHQLATAELQLDSYSLLVKAGVEQVERAAAELMHLAESLHPREERLNPNICGICCSRFQRPYRLQACSHLFCLECLQSYFKTVLNDMSLFPVRCPQCCQPVSLRDLESSLSKPEWQKLTLMGANQYVGMNSERMRFCYTVGCKQINFLKGPTWNCDTCKISYCNACRETSHEGIKCEDVLEIRQSDEYFKKYMMETGGRFCAKESCRMPVVRIDGCFKVQCTRCKTCMCFKCPPDRMTPYQNPNDCYTHLNSVHGGYF